jgi:uracil-DNA glycosylase
VENVTDRLSNPFGMQPPCRRFVPGYGDANADFHVIGDHPGAHGGADPTSEPGAVGYPFTNAAGMGLQRALVEAGLLHSTGTPPEVERTFLSYLHACVPEDGAPTGREYDDMERFFDAELRAIAAHVLLPVGHRPTLQVLAEYTAEPVDRIDPETLHATEIRGGGWLVVPVADPAGWSDADERALVDALVTLQQTDFRRQSDLGRFLPGGDPYFVR